MTDKDSKPGNSAKRPTKKKADQAKPLPEAIEEEMLDQDIPVETGVKPGTGKTR